MARLKGSFGTPAYCRHKASNRGYATIDGSPIYLPGNFNSRESRAAYDRLIGEYLANGRRIPNAAPVDTITVAEVIAAYWIYVKGYHTQKEASNIAESMRPVKRLYASIPAAKFGPLALKSVREEMVTLGWCRNVVNRQVNRVRQCFKWAVGNELISPVIHQALAAVPGLKRGKTAARETLPVRPVPQAHVDAMLPFVSPTVADMVRLQLLTGARPGEICSMKSAYIDTAGHVWLYKPPEHKTANRGFAREIRLGPRAQDIIRPFLKTDLSAYLFSPAESENQRHARQRQLRQSHVQPAHVARAERSRKLHRQKFTEHYDVAAYRRAIWRGCDAANPPPPELARKTRETAQAWKARLSPGQLAEVKKWRKEKRGKLPEHLARNRGETAAQWQARLTPKQREILQTWRADHRWNPHQLRHNFATNVRREHGIEMARILLGHKGIGMNITELYAEADMARATDIMGKIG